MLARSPFSDITVTSWDHTLTRSLDDVIGLQFSYSSPAQLGSDKDAFETDLRTALTEEPTGHFTETVRTEAIICTRPRWAASAGRGYLSRCPGGVA